MIRRTFSALLCLSALLSTAPMIQAHEAGKQMAEVATLLLSVLTPEQKAKATFAFEDEERINWHFIPRERNADADRAANEAMDRRESFTRGEYEMAVRCASFRPRLPPLQWCRVEGARYVLSR